MSKELREEVKHIHQTAYGTVACQAVDESIALIHKATLDEVQALTFEEPEYISNSQEHRRGYNKALDNMNIAIKKLRGE